MAANWDAYKKPDHYQTSATSSGSQNWRPTLVGTKVATVKNLKSADQYVVVEVQPHQLYLVVRRVSKRFNENLSMHELNFTITLHASPGANNGESLITMGEQLYTILSEIYSSIASAVGDRQDYAINFSTSFRGLDNSYVTQVTPFTEANRDSIILQLIDQLYNFGQSAKLDQQVRELFISATVTPFMTRANGIYRPLSCLPISDANFRRKAYGPLNPNGSLLYCDTANYCLMVSCYLGLLYKAMTEEYSEKAFTKKGTFAEHKSAAKEIGKELHNTLDLKGLALEDACKEFFNKYGIDITQYEDKHEQFLKIVSTNFNVQVSLFDQNNGWNIIKRYPEQLCLNLRQIYCVKVEHLLRSDRAFEKKVIPHYHGMVAVRRSLFGVR